MRIISGKHKGRKIELGKEAASFVRPTSDFAREAIFNILSHSDLGLDRHAYIDQDVLDACCGTGALGLEALSRGAKHVTFVDKSREALANAHFNAKKCTKAPPPITSTPMPANYPAPSANSRLSSSTHPISKHDGTRPQSAP